MTDASPPNNPYEAPRASLDDLSSMRGSWTGRDEMDMIGGVFWVCFGSFWVVLGTSAFWLGRPTEVMVPGFGTLAFGLFLLSRVAKARRRARRFGRDL